MAVKNPSTMRKTKWLNWSPPKNWLTLACSVTICFLRRSLSLFLDSKCFSSSAVMLAWLTLPTCSFRWSKTSKSGLITCEMDYCL